MSWLKDYFSFTRKERNAFIVCIILMITFIFLPDFFKPKKVSAVVSEDVKEALDKKTAQGRSTAEDDHWESTYEPEPQKPAKLFAFDPNTLSQEGFILLGLPLRTARTIINYRNKGGRFRKPEDLRKIYSLQREDADRIIPYARIEGSENSNNYFSDHSRPGYEKKTYTTKPIDINTATIEEWKSLPGIGEVLSARIIKFRERIGGFASVSQVAKTYGLPDSTFQKILPYLELAAPADNRININTAFENELLECPSVSPDVAKAIIIYRKQHGNYQTLDDLKKIVFITEDLFQKIAPCLKVN